VQPNEIGRTYDAWTDLLRDWSPSWPDDDVKLATELAAEMPGPVVELGVGSGRVARSVSPDYGVDVSVSMLEQARRNLPASVELLHADFAGYRLPRQAGFSYLVSDALNHVLDDDLLDASLVNIRGQTRPGGVLLVDSFVPDFDRLRREHEIPKLKHVTDNRALWYVKRLREPMVSFDLHAVVDRLDGRGGTLGRTYLPPIALRCRSPENWRAHFQATGWTVRDLWSSYDRSPFEPAATRQIWLLTL